MNKIKKYKDFVKHDLRSVDDTRFDYYWFEKVNDKVNEASINAKRRSVKFGTSWFMNGTKNLGNIGSFGIVTPYNPYNKKATNAENNKYAKDFYRIIKNMRCLYVPLQGKYKGKKDDDESKNEKSFLLFNITNRDIEYIAARFEQESYFYCYPESETEVISEYYEKRFPEKNWDAVNNPYEFINKTNLYHNREGEQNNFTIIGKYKFVIDNSVFDDASKQIENSVNEIVKHMRNTPDEILNESVNCIGQKSAYISDLMYDSFKFYDEEYL